MATLIKVDGSEQEVHPEKGTTFTLEELQNLVGGYIERIQVGSKEMYLNEDGKMKRLPLNRRATMIARLAGIADSDYVVGDVLIGISKEFD